MYKKSRGDSALMPVADLLPKAAAAAMVKTTRYREIIKAGAVQYLIIIEEVDMQTMEKNKTTKMVVFRICLCTYPQVGLNNFFVVFDLIGGPFGNFTAIVEDGNAFTDIHDQIHIMLN